MSVMAEVHVLDNYYLAITLLITIGYQLFFFSIAFSLKFDKLTGMTDDPRSVLSRLSVVKKNLQNTVANQIPFQISLEEPTLSS